MEIFFFLSLLPCFLLLTYRFTRKQKPQPTNDENNPPPLPPGTTGLPLIGETLDYSSNLRNGDLGNFVKQRLLKYSSKVFKTSLIGQTVAILPGPEGNKFLFSNEKKLVHVWFPSSIDKIFPKSHNKTNHEAFIKVRKMLPSFLKPDALRKYVGVMDSVMKKNLHTHWSHDNYEEIKKVYHLVSKNTLSLGCQIFLSIDDMKRVEELGKLIENIHAGMFSLPINFPGTALNRAIKASKMMRDEINAMVRKRKIDISEIRATAPQDMLSLMLQTADEDGHFFNESDISSHLLGLLQGSYSSLNDVLCFIIKYLAELPHVYREVLREQIDIHKSKESNNLLDWEDLRKMKYSWNVANEVLRIMPTETGAFREAITDFTYAGYTIPTGWKIHWIAHATHKNPDHFPDPERFDPSRFEGSGPAPYTFVPFGGGPRMCPGVEYARVCILVFMHNLVTKFEWNMIGCQNFLTRLALSPVPGFQFCLHPHNS